MAIVGLFPFPLDDGRWQANTECHGKHEESTDTTVPVGKGVNLFEAGMKGREGTWPAFCRVKVIDQRRHQSVNLRRIGQHYARTGDSRLYR